MKVQIMDDPIVELAKALRKHLGKIGICLDQFCELVQEHERRLAELESVKRNLEGR
jgi:hypothetical protein